MEHLKVKEQLVKEVSDLGFEDLTEQVEIIANALATTKERDYKLEYSIKIFPDISIVVHIAEKVFGQAAILRKGIDDSLFTEVISTHLTESDISTFSSMFAKK